MTSLTSMFMHGSWFHIIGNMLFLWIFGNNVEDAMGKVRFLVFYLLAGFAATALQPSSRSGRLGCRRCHSQRRRERRGLGVLGAYLVLLPNASVLTLVFFFLIEVPAYFFLGFWFLFQLSEGGFSLRAPGRRRRRVLRPHRRLRLRRGCGAAVHETSPATTGVLMETSSSASTFGRPSTRCRTTSPRGLENVAVVVEDESPESPYILGTFFGHPHGERRRRVPCPRGS